jgi:hypothetical protein
MDDGDEGLSARELMQRRKAIEAEQRRTELIERGRQEYLSNTQARESNKQSSHGRVPNGGGGGRLPTIEQSRDPEPHNPMRDSSQAHNPMRDSSSSSSSSHRGERDRPRDRDREKDRDRNKGRDRDRGRERDRDRLPIPESPIARPTSRQGQQRFSFLSVPRLYAHPRSFMRLVDVTCESRTHARTQA